MVVVDTSVWIDHLRHSDVVLTELLGHADVLMHPMVIGELALGSLRNRNQVLESFAALRTVTVATHDEAMRLVERRHLYGTGLSLVDAQLLASVLLTSGTRLWTRDSRLAAAAASLGINYS